MKTKYSRRDLMTTVAAVALIDTTMTSATTAQAAMQTPESSAIKTRVASCNCGQLTATCTGPDPERRSLCFCKNCQMRTGSAFSIQTRFPRDQVTIQGKSKAWKFPIEGAQPVTYRSCDSAA